MAFPEVGPAAEEEESRLPAKGEGNRLGSVAGSLPEAVEIPLVGEEDRLAEDEEGILLAGADWAADMVVAVVEKAGEEGSHSSRESTISQLLKSWRQAS